MMLRTLPGRFHPEALFRPASVAVIGAETAIGKQVMANLVAGGFSGAILPVGARLKAVGGILAYADVAALPIAPDLAIVATPGEQVGDVMRALGAKGTRAAVVAGDGEGLRGLARETGVRSLGARSFGVAVPGIGLNATRSHIAPRPGRVALVSQSAALCRAVLDWAEPNGVGFSHVVGIGVNDDLGFGRVLDWLSRDGGTGAILLDIRRIKDARAFLSAARAAARLRPVVALRAGMRLQDPTGEADATFIAALQRCGVLCVASLDDLLAAAETLTRAKPVRGEGLAIVTNAIGPAQMAADAALRDGLTLATLAPETLEVLKLKQTSPRPEPVPPGLVHADTGNPASLAETAALLAGAKEVGGIIVVHAPTGAGDEAGIAAIVAAASSVKVPLLVCAMGETTGAGHRRRLAAAGIPAFAAPEHAVRGFLHLVQDRRNRAAARELPPSTVLQFVPDRQAVGRRFAEVRAEGRLTLSQDEAMEVLAAYGVSTVPSRAARSADEAAAIAEGLGFPVVLKRRRVARSDPSARGDLMLDLRDAAGVRAAAALSGGDFECPGFVVQRQIGRARELRVQLGDDPLFGPAFRFGQGGTASDVLNDVAVELPPLNLPLAKGLIARTRVAATLKALHDQPPADVEAVAEALVRISQLVVDFPEIAALDINPLFADPAGAFVADAWLSLRTIGEAGHLAIPPYPAELVGSYEAKGTTFEIRPIRPEDAEAHGAFFLRLPAQDVRYRFFSALRSLSAEQLARLTQVDYEREMAFIAVRAPGETVGVARIVRETDSPEGEFAIAVQPDAKGTGVARHLMERLIAWARQQGMSEVVGQVLADNAPMLAFVRRLGFTLRRMPDEPEIMEARLVLT